MISLAPQWEKGRKILTYYLSHYLNEYEKLILSIYLVKEITLKEKAIYRHMY